MGPIWCQLLTRSSVLLLISYVVIVLLLKPDTGVEYHILKEHQLQLTQSLNLARQEHLEKICDAYNYSGKSYKLLTDLHMNHLLYEKKSKLLYCFIPKVACTNWKRVLMIIANKTNETDPLQVSAALAHSDGMFPKFSSLSDVDKEEVLDRYTRIIFVRHPFERLLSAYRNKFEGDLPSAQYFQSRIGRLIVKNFRPHATNESLLRGHDVTFNEFVQYLLTPELSRINEFFNEHWESMTKLCHPCIFKYNLIGKYETLVDDAALALSLSGIQNVTFPLVQKTSGTNEKLRQYYEQLSFSTIRNLYKLYEFDFKLFGYRLDDIIGFELE